MSKHFQLASILLLASAGCSEPSPGVTLQPAEAKVEVVETPFISPPRVLPQGATRIEVGEDSLAFDPETCVRGHAEFSWGLGSTSVTILGRETDQCVFDVYEEVEGGFGQRRYRVPIDGPRVEIGAENGRQKTSLVNEPSELIVRGSLHLGIREPRSQQTPGERRTVDIPGSGFYVSRLEPELVVGSGGAVAPSKRVTMRCTVFADREFVTPYIGLEQPLTLRFMFGKNEVEPGIEAAVRGMRVGGKRRAWLREEIAKEIGDAMGGVQPGTILAVELEVVAVE